MVDKKNNNIEPIDGSFDDVVGKIVNPAPPKGNNFKCLGVVSADYPAPQVQIPLDLGIQVEKNVNGIEMGVLENGLPYLTQSGLARMTGAARKTIFEITKVWEQEYSEQVIGSGRNGLLKEYLFKNGYTEPTLYMELQKDGSTHYAYPDIVCMALLEYYAFEAKNPIPDAITNYRNLARFGLQKFIYEALEYTPEDKWKYFNDRVSILQGSAPADHFTLFSETTGLSVDLINADLPVNDKTLPDISVGLGWGKLWTSAGLEQEFGPRIKYEHNYPSYYPQSASNPQTLWAYPDVALPLFRRWFRNEYLPTKFPRYILTKAKVLKGGTLEAEKIAALFDQKMIEG